MPNWSYNSLSVKVTDANKGEVKKLIESVKLVEKGDGEVYVNPFSLQKIIPMPKELENTTAPSGKPNKELIKKYGADNWYDWRWNNWGVKWDTSNTEATNLDGEWFVEFDTPWVYPGKAMVELSKKFPNLVFNYGAEEESGEYDIEFTLVNGKCTRLLERIRDDENDVIGFKELNPNTFNESI